MGSKKNRNIFSVSLFCIFVLFSCVIYLHNYGINTYSPTFIFLVSFVLYFFLCHHIHLFIVFAKYSHIYLTMNDDKMLSRWGKIPPQELLSHTHIHIYCRYSFPKINNFFKVLNNPPLNLKRLDKVKLLNIFLIVAFHSDGRGTITSTEEQNG